MEEQNSKEETKTTTESTKTIKNHGVQQENFLSEIMMKF